MDDKERIKRDYDGVLRRERSTKTQTIGEFTFYDENGKVIFSCKTVELEVDCNARRDDAIPNGLYKVVLRYSAKYKNHFHITGVPNRSLILMHNANFSRELLGCVGVGKKHADIDKDGLIDVTSSKATMKEMMSKLPDEWMLRIVQK